MLGCGLEPNTSMHAIEELVEPPYLYNPETEYHITLANGAQITKTYKSHNFHGWHQRYDRIEQVMVNGLQRGRILTAGCYLLESQALWNCVLPALLKDPLRFASKVEPSDGEQI